MVWYWGFVRAAGKPTQEPAALDDCEITVAKYRY